MEARRLFAILVALALQNGRRVWSGESQGHRSICEKYHRVNVTQQVSYVETFEEYQEYDHYEPATRLNFRQEVVPKWLKVVACCEGYEPRGREELAEDCVPVCPSGCTFGECLMPNVCNCTLGYEACVNETTGYGDCRPYCESGCLGGVCIAPETCTCNPGYRPSSRNKSCEPSCYDVGAGGAQGCGPYGICTAPNVCQCEKGHTPATGNVTGPKSLTGFDQHGTIRNWSEVFCRPICEPECGENASCAAPNQCRCDEGYRWATSVGWAINQTCVPVCEQICFNGYCAGPNECRCNEGYAAHTALGSHVCDPICLKGCVNGKCIMPNHCECLEGYAKPIVRNGSLETGIPDNVCTPVCLGLCRNGRCAAPGLCHCDPGYVLASANEERAVMSTTTAQANRGNLSGHLPQTCRPFCEPRCGEGSICVAPNRCQMLLPTQGHLHDRITESVRIVYSRYDCGSHGVFSDRNNTDCACSYYRGDSGDTCSEPVLCAVIILGNSSRYDREFDGLKSLRFWSDTSGAAGKSINETGSSSSRVGFDWADTKCSKECRIFIFVNKSVDEVRKNDVVCHPLKLYDSITGLVFTTLATLPPGNGSGVCFIKDRFECHYTKSFTIIGIVVWVIIFLNVVLVISVPTYLNRRKIWKKRFQDRTRANGSTMQHPEGGTDSPFQADESHL